MIILTDHLMLDVLRLAITASGELCVVLALTTTTHGWPVPCWDLGEFHLCLFSVNTVLHTLTCVLKFSLAASVYGSFFSAQ